MAAPPASSGAAGNQPRATMWRAEAVRLWEELIDSDPDLAEELFFDALLRDARAEQARRGWKGPEHGQVVGSKDDDAVEEEQQRRARVFQPWAPSAPGSALPPLPPVNRSVVLALRAPPHLLASSKHGRTPSAPAAGPRQHPEHVKKPPAV